jgi:hypothetical protein
MVWETILSQISEEMHGVINGTFPVVQQQGLLYQPKLLLAEAQVICSKRYIAMFTYPGWSCIKVSISPKKAYVYLSLAVEILKLRFCLVALLVPLCCPPSLWNYYIRQWSGVPLSKQRSRTLGLALDFTARPTISHYPHYSK